MKALTTILSILLFLAGTAQADVFVRGYFRRDGTYVRPHYRSDPDGIVSNNWSHCGNINPYTGAVGTKGCGGSFIYEALNGKVVYGGSSDGSDVIYLDTVVPAISSDQLVRQLAARILNPQPKHFDYLLNEDGTVNVVSADGQQFGSLPEKEALAAFGDGSYRPMTAVEREKALNIQMMQDAEKFRQESESSWMWWGLAILAVLIVIGARKQGDA